MFIVWKNKNLTVLIVIVWKTNIKAFRRTQSVLNHFPSPWQHTQLAVGSGGLQFKIWTDKLQNHRLDRFISMKQNCLISVSEEIGLNHLGLHWL